MAREREEEILRRVVREVRSDAVPELDWDEMEARLMRRAQRADVVRKSSFDWRPFALVGLAAAGAALLVAVTRKPAPPIPAPAPAPQAKKSSDTNGDTLEVGSSIVATDQPVRVRHRDRAVWTLSPGSKATLLQRVGRLILRLESGSIHSEVIPNLGHDAFVVEVGEARISVQGTVFKVELRGDRIRVGVSRGAVGIGPRTAVAAPPVFVLEAGSQGDFALDGRTGHVNKAERASGAVHAPARTPAQAARERAATEPAPSASATSPEELPTEPSIADIESGVMDVVEVAGSCFTRHTAPGDGVEVTVRTAVTLEIRPEGSAEIVEFSPPLSPAVEACAEAGVRQLSFARSLEGAKVTRLLELKR